MRQALGTKASTLRCANSRTRGLGLNKSDDDPFDHVGSILVSISKKETRRKMARQSLTVQRLVQDGDKDMAREFSLFSHARGDKLFTQSWTSIFVKVRGLVVPLHGLNEHSVKYNGTIQGLKYIWRMEGLNELFKGNSTNCARIVPNSAVKFFSYEQASKGIRYLHQQRTGNDDAQGRCCLVFVYYKEGAVDLTLLYFA